MDEVTLYGFAQSGNAIAELSLCGYLWFADEMGVDWNDYPKVSAALQASPLSRAGSIPTH